MLISLYLFSVGVACTLFFCEKARSYSCGSGDTRLPSMATMKIDMGFKIFFLWLRQLVLHQDSCALTLTAQTSRRHHSPLLPLSSIHTGPLAGTEPPPRRTRLGRHESRRLPLRCRRPPPVPLHLHAMLAQPPEPRGAPPLLPSSPLPPSAAMRSGRSTSGCSRPRRQGRPVPLSRTRMAMRWM
jgi:hypothetical protein